MESRLIRSAGQFCLLSIWLSGCFLGFQNCVRLRRGLGLPFLQAFDFFQRQTTERIENPTIAAEVARIILPMFRIANVSIVFMVFWAPRSWSCRHHFWYWLTFHRERRTVPAVVVGGSPIALAPTLVWPCGSPIND